MKAIKDFFGKTQSGEDVYIHTLENDNGMSVCISEFGGAIVKLLVPDKKGNIADLVCGYDDLSSYELSDGYQGALIGRFGNRIGKARFELDGVTYDLYKNNGNNHLHGGKVGFSHRVWNSEITENDNSVSLKLALLSPDGEENYPGNLSVTVIYTLDNENTLTIEYSAATDKKTILNLTNHTYFNLAGYDSGKIFDHKVTILADRFLPTDKELIPTGDILSVENTPFDFRREKSIGKDFYSEDVNLKNAGGYDHCLIFEDSLSPDIPKISVKDDKSGRTMQVYTDMPAVHFYTGNFMKNKDYPFKNNYEQVEQNAFCLETEKMPDSINHKNFTDCTLDVGKAYSTFTKFKFII